MLGKVLQGVTLYGLVDALCGPGLVFDRFASPFRLDGLGAPGRGCAGLQLLPWGDRDRPVGFRPQAPWI